MYSVFQTKFAGAPLQLEDAIGRIRQLNTPSVTREKVHSIAADSHSNDRTTVRHSCSFITVTITHNTPLARVV